MARRVERGPNQLQCVRVADLPTPHFRSKQLWCEGCTEPVWVCAVALLHCGDYIPVCSACQPAIKVHRPANG